MTMTDPIADMLTRIRNQINVSHQEVDIPFSGIKEKIAEVLKEEGFIDDYKVFTLDERKFLKLRFIYLRGEKNRISGLKRISKPGLRVYSKEGKLPITIAHRGIVILSTSTGVMTSKEAKKKGVGGEVLCRVW